MDASMLKVICDGYESRISRLDNQVQQLGSELIEERMFALCAARGGHEFKKKTEGMCSEPYEKCKFCGFLKDNA